MDGLLLNTQNMYSKVSQTLLAKHGKVSDQEFRMKVIGRAAPEAAKMIVEFYQLPYEPDEYLAMVEKELESLFPTCDFLPGARMIYCHCPLFGKFDPNSNYIYVIILAPK